MVATGSKDEQVPHACEAYVHRAQSLAVGGAGAIGAVAGRGAADTFDFLGFTHMWVRSRRGFLVLRQTTAKDRFARAVRAVRDWCRWHRHAPLPDQREHLARVIRGHCAYYGRIGNSARLSSFRFQVIHTWRKWLSRRSRSDRIDWDQMVSLLRQHPLPPAKAVHSKLVA